MVLDDLHTLTKGQILYSNIGIGTAKVVSSKPKMDRVGRPEVEVVRQYGARTRFWVSRVSVDLWRLTPEPEHVPDHAHRVRRVRVCK